VERKASGLRKSLYKLLTDEDIQSLKSDIAAIKADVSVFKFNEGPCTCYVDAVDTVYVRGDVFPDDVYSIHPRDMMSARAVLAHEYYGHRRYKDTPLKQQSWNDEFRASYIAARDTPGLSGQDRMLLVLDAMERAKSVGVTIKWNNFMRSVVYGSNYQQTET